MNVFLILVIHFCRCGHFSVVTITTDIVVFSFENVSPSSVPPTFHITCCPLCAVAYGGGEASDSHNCTKWELFTVFFSGDMPAFVLYSFTDIRDAEMAQDAVKADAYCIQLVPR
jgi:hypothetical protein